MVCSSSIYGGTYNLFAVTMKRMGIDFTFVDPDCTEAELEAAFDITIPAVEVVVENFNSVDGLTAMVKRLVEDQLD